MERVQFEQEQMLPELKDLVQKGIFSDKEAKQILRKRTTFETALVRRVTKKSDFLRYIGYEMNLEALRRKRVVRLNLPHSPPTISDYAIVRRQFKIFERALRKFRDDIGLWIQYIRLAKREKARALVGRITARALKLHPTHPSLYILAASHELTHLSPTAARTLLQRGLRLNPESVELWREYMKVELGFIESLRRRWELLGVGDGKKQAGGGTEGDVEMGDGDQEDETSLEQEKAREEILSGALVKTIIDSAIQSLPKFALISSLHSTLLSYPLPPTLRTSLLDHFFVSVESSPTLRDTPEAIKLHATRSLHARLEGAELVEALTKANEELLGSIRSADGKSAGEIAVVYASFVEEWVQKDVDENLKLYLFTSLQSLATSSKKATPSLLASHLRLLTSSHIPQSLPPQKLIKVSRKYTSKFPRSSELWLLRLDIEAKHTEKEGWMKSWEEARNSVAGDGKSGDEENREKIWFWGLDRIESQPIAERIEVTEMLLAKSLPQGSPALPTKLLLKYVDLLHAQFTHEINEGTYKTGTLVKRLERMAEKYLPTEEVWQRAFELFSASTKPTEDDSSSTSESDSDSESDLPVPTPTQLPDLPPTLHTIYTRWRLLHPHAHCRAALAYGAYLFRVDRGTEAAEVVERARAEVEAGEKAAFEKAWRGVVDGDEEGNAGGAAGEGDEGKDGQSESEEEDETFGMEV